MTVFIMPRTWVEVSFVLCHRKISLVEHELNKTEPISNLYI